MCQLNQYIVQIWLDYCMFIMGERFTYVEKSIFHIVAFTNFAGPPNASQWFFTKANHPMKMKFTLLIDQTYALAFEKELLAEICCFSF